MLLFLPTSILTLSLLAILVSLRLDADARRNWLIASAGAGLAWFSMLFLRVRLPLAGQTPGFSVLTFNQYQLNWQMDGVAWSLLFAFLSYYLIFTLSQVTVFSDRENNYWLLSILSAILAGVSALAANPLALLILWFFVDMLALFWLRSDNRAAQIPNSWQMGFSINLVAIALLVWLWLSFPISSLAFDSLNAGILLTVVLLRVGLLPLHITKFPSGQNDDAGEIFASLAAMFPALVVLPRLSFLLPFSFPIYYWLLLACLLIFALKWFISESFGQGSAYFLLLTMGFAALFSINDSQNGSLHWLFILMLVAGLLPLFEQISVYRIAIYALGVWLISPFSFSPNFSSAIFFTNASWISSLMFLLSLSLLIAGWLRHTRGLKVVSSRLESWQRSVFFGTVILSVLLLILLPLGLLPLTYANVQPPPIWALAAIALGAAALYYFAPRIDPYIRFAGDFAERVIAVDWHARWITRAWEIATPGLRIFTRLLEGSSGILWALLLVVLMLSLISQLASGG